MSSMFKWKATWVEWEQGAGEQEKREKVRLVWLTRSIQTIPSIFPTLIQPSLLALPVIPKEFSACIPVVVVLVETFHWLLSWNFAWIGDWSNHYQPGEYDVSVLMSVMHTLRMSCLCCSCIEHFSIVLWTSFGWWRWWGCFRGRLRRSVLRRGSRSGVRHD